MYRTVTVGIRAMVSISGYLCDLEKDLGKLSLIIGPLFEERDVSRVFSGPTKEI